MTALESEAEALQLNRPQMTVYTLSGVLTGGLLGLLFAAMYRRNQSIEQQLRRAIENDELRVVYQPVVEMATGRIVGAEALARWTDDHGLVVSPEIFVQIAENLGFVQEITRLVIRRTLQDFQGTMRRSPEFGVHVNITSADLSDAGFLPMLEGAVKAAEVTSRNLMMEITESSTVHFERAIEAIRQLRQKGYAVYIDDFGTGYSSLAYLHRLSIDAIKIDRSFVQAIGTDAVTVSILPLILSAAEQLNLNVVVEGVETREQADYFLTSKRPMRAQGWLYGRPVAAEEFLRLLGENERG
jgi:sensor c-di-GMP phosphodiesterase-like protein